MKNVLEMGFKGITDREFVEVLLDRDLAGSGHVIYKTPHWILGRVRQLL